MAATLSGGGTILGPLQVCSIRVLPHKGAGGSHSQTIVRKGIEDKLLKINSEIMLIDSCEICEFCEGGVLASFLNNSGF